MGREMTWSDLCSLHSYMHASTYIREFQYLRDIYSALHHVRVLKKLVLLGCIIGIPRDMGVPTASCILSNLHRRKSICLPA